MSFREEGGFTILKLDPEIVAFLTAWHNRDTEALTSLGVAGSNVDVKELIVSLLFLWERALEVGEELGGPPIKAVLAGMGLGIALSEEGDDNGS